MTSGAFAHYSDVSLAFGYVPAELAAPGASGEQWGRLEVEIIGHRRPACCSRNPSSTRPGSGCGRRAVSPLRAADDRRPRWRRTRTSPGCGRRRRSPGCRRWPASSSPGGRRRSRCCATRRRSPSMTPVLDRTGCRIEHALTRRGSTPATARRSRSHFGRRVAERFGDVVQREVGQLLDAIASGIRGRAALHAGRASRRGGRRRQPRHR